MGCGVNHQFIQSPTQAPITPNYFEVVNCPCLNCWLARGGPSAVPGKERMHDAPEGGRGYPRPCPSFCKEGGGGPAIPSPSLRSPQAPRGPAAWCLGSWTSSGMSPSRLATTPPIPPPPAECASRLKSKDLEFGLRGPFRTERHVAEVLAGHELRVRAHTRRRILHF